MVSADERTAANERDGGGFSRRRLLRIGAVGAVAASAGCSSLQSDSTSVENDGSSRTYTLTVRLEEEGEPASEASVSVQSTQLVPQADAQIPGRDGVVTFDLEDGEYIVQVQSQEFSNVDEPVTIDGEDAEVTIALQRGFG